MKIKRLINFFILSALLLASVGQVKTSQSKTAKLREIIVSKTGFLCKIYRDYTSLITYVEIVKTGRHVYSFNLKSPYPLSFKDVQSHCAWAFQEEFLNLAMFCSSVNTSIKKIIIATSYDKINLIKKPNDSIDTCFNVLEKNRIAPSGVALIDEFNMDDFIVSDNELARIAQGIDIKKSSINFCTVEGSKLIDCAYFNKDFLSEVYYDDKEKKVKVLTKKESELFGCIDFDSEKELSFYDVIRKYPYFFPENRLGHIEKVCSFNDDGLIKNEKVYPQACFKYIFLCP